MADRVFGAAQASLGNLFDHGVGRFPVSGAGQSDEYFFNRCESKGIESSVSTPCAAREITAAPTPRGSSISIARFLRIDEGRRPLLFQHGDRFLE